MTEDPLRVCMLGTYEADYDRNRVLLRGLRECGVEVVECHSPVWERMRFKTNALRGPFQYAAVAVRLSLAYLGLFFRYMTAPAHDVVFVGYLGHFDVFPARFWSWLRLKPLAFDAFVSLYDTSVEDRGLFPRASLAAKVLRWVDRRACGLSDLVLLDTNQHAAYFAEELGVDPAKLQRVLVGADPAYADAVSAPAASDEDSISRFVVLHYSKFAPLHGIEHVLDAASLLRDRPEIVFKIVGGGQTFEAGKAHAERLGLRNLELIPWLEPDELRKAIADADVCLGIFGDTRKASRVVPNKVYQCLAAGRPTITGRSPATEEILDDRENVLLCEMASGQAIADAILELQRDPSLRRRLGEGGARSFRDRFTPAEIVRSELLPRLKELAERRSGPSH